MAGKLRAYFRRVERKRARRMRTTMSTQTTRVIHVYSYGGPEQLKLEQKPRPEPQADEVLLRVHAAGVNQIDWKIRQGLMKDFQPVTFPYTPGIEVAGVVEGVGPGVTAFEIGQAVFGQSARGAYAEYITESVEALALKPETLSFAEAATVPVGATTPVESVVQDVDLVLDGVGGETLISSLAALRRGGTLISIAGLPPQEEAQARGVRAAFIRNQYSRELLQTVARLIDEGRIKVTAGKTFPLSEVQQAHEYSRSGHGRGRIVLQIADEAENTFA